MAPHTASTTMNRVPPRSVLLVLGLCTWLLMACAPDPQPLVFGPPAWGDGEVSLYRAVDRRGEVVGGVRYEVRAGGQHVDPDGWTLVREITEAEATEVVTVEMAGRSYIPVYTALERRDDQGSQRVETRIQRTRADLTLTDRLGNVTYQRLDIPSDIRDERTLPLIVRALPLEPGYLARMNSFLPVVGVFERVTVQVRDPEEITVPAGRFQAWKVTLETNDRTTTLWIDVEPPHPTVRIQDGRSRATFELLEFTPGR